MDENIKIELKPQVDFESECEKVELEILNPTNEVDERLDEIESQIVDLDISIDKLTNHADKLDYTVAVASGILTGLIDAFFVKKFELQSTDDIIKTFAENKGWSEDSKKSIQDFLEDNFHTPNDAAYQKGRDILGKKIAVGGKTHRFDEIAHHPTLEGLVATIIVRFFKVTTYINKNGKKHITTVDISVKDVTMTLVPVIIAGTMLWLAKTAENYNELETDSKIPKALIDIIKLLSTAPMIIEILKCADDWLGHIMSDVGTKAGIPGVFLSFLKYVSSLPILKFTPFPKYVEQLYLDKKFSLYEELPVIQALSKQALPIFINEIIVRSFYFVRHLVVEFKENGGFEHINWERTIPFGNRTIERMMTIATGTFTAIDTIDAVIEGAISGAKAGPGFWAEFGRQVVLRLNFVGIGRFTIALGTDAFMGLRKGKKSRERMLLKAESLYLLEAKMCYGDQLMWTAVKDAGQSVDSLFEAMQKLSTQITEDMKAAQGSIREIENVDISAIDANNKGLTAELLDNL